MDRTEQPARADDTRIALIPPAEAAVCDQYLNEHGDYENWSAETVQAYRNTIHHAAAFGTV